MKRVAAVLLLTSSLVASVSVGEELAPDVQAAKSLEQLSVEVGALVTKDRIHNMFDRFRLLANHGFTYQPSLVAPFEAMAGMNEQSLRMFAGMKLFDAVYAATFLRPQAVADSAACVEAVEEALDLRSHADLSNRCLQTLRKAAADPLNVDVEKLIEQLSSDYVSEIPALMSNEKSAVYLIDSLYGFLIEMSYAISELVRNDASGLLEEGLNSVSNTEARRMILDLFKAFDRMDEKIRAGADVVEKVGIIKQAIYLSEAERSGRMTEDDAEHEWDVLTGTVMGIRDSILSGPPH